MHTTEVLASAIVGHLVGDYLLQNDWMALNKKKDAFPCAVHCALWTISVMMFAGWMHPVENEFDIWFNPIILVMLFTTHFIQDYTNIVKFWMTRINRQPKFVEPPMAPWSLIVVDNVWHILTIWIIWRVA